MRYLLFAISALAAFVYTSAVSAFPEGPPPRHTGGKLSGNQQPDCSVCHFSGPDPSAQSGLTLQGWPDQVEPDAVYELKLQLLDPEAKVGGFQLLIVNSEGASGIFNVLAKQQVVSEEQFEYLGHTEPTHTVEDEETGEMKVVWQIQWRAPREPGVFAIFAAAVGADDDDSPLGDTAYTLSIAP